MNNIDLSSAAMKNVTCDGDIYTFSEKGGMLVFESEAGSICSVSANKDDYIVFEITNLSKYSESVIFSFWESDNRQSDITVKIGVLPGVKTVTALKEESAEGGTLFLKRTPGRLKTVVHGHPIKLSTVKRFSFGVTPSPSEVKIQIHRAYISKSEPCYTVPDVKLTDVFGQKKLASWKGKTTSEEELNSYLNSELLKKASPPKNFSKYGGWFKKRFEPTGYFGLEHENGRYWLKDPDGYAFFSSGLDCVGIDGDCNLTGIESFCDYLPPKGTVGWAKYARDNESFFSWSKYNLWRVFGDNWYDSWAKITARRLCDWGMNTVACWSDMKFIKRSGLPYVHILNGFPRTKNNIFRDFPDVFSDEYAAESEKWAAQLAPLADDKKMIGYFMSNEPNWAFVDGLNIAKLTLEREESFASKDHIISYLKDKYKTVSALNASWGTELSVFEDLAVPQTEFSEAALSDLEEISCEMVRQFIKVPALALKKVDENHLNLGMRYAWLSSPALAAGSEYFDVFSFNCYRHDPYDSIERIVQMVKMPVMIGEFHFGALDRGLDATGIQGVMTQDDRAKAYRFYMHRAAMHPYCLGAHYFTLNDQAYLGRFDGENYQIGFVDVCNREYEEIVASAKRTAEEIYPVAAGEIAPTDVKPTEIYPICY